MKKIILASGSPRRRELLTQIGIDFDVVTSNAEEIITRTYPQDIVCELSCLKAKAVYDMLKESRKDIDNSVIIGADTIVYCDGEILGKPADNDDAYRMIKKISGGVHQVYTGVTFIYKGNVKSFSEKTDVSVYDMSETEINRYIQTGEAIDKAGAYGIQGAFAAYVNGDYNNVVGLPVAKLYHELADINCL
jgi:septum formation protein